MGIGRVCFCLTAVFNQHPAFSRPSLLQELTKKEAEPWTDGPVRKTSGCGNSSSFSRVTPVLRAFILFGLPLLVVMSAGLSASEALDIPGGSLPLHPLQEAFSWSAWDEQCMRCRSRVVGRRSEVSVTCVMFVSRLLGFQPLIGIAVGLGKLLRGSKHPPASQRLLGP